METDYRICPTRTNASWSFSVLVLTMSVLGRYWAMVLVGLAIVVGTLFLPISMRLLFRGKSSDATVTEISSKVMRGLVSTVHYRLDTPQGPYYGTGITRQYVEVGNTLAVVYLPDDPATVVPIDDPTADPKWVLVALILGGAFVITGVQGLSQAWQLERAHKETARRLSSE